VLVVDGLPITTVGRTAVDVACAVPLADALPVVDAALRRLTQVAVRVDPTGAAQGMTERELVLDARVVAAVRRTLLRILDETGRRRGRTRAVRAIQTAHPAAENGFESVSRARLLLGGVPTPEVGYPVRGDDGRTYWADLAWPALRVLGEADGRLKYDRPGALYAEKRRQEALERAGWIVVRWTWDELLRTPEVVVARVLAALDRAAAGRAA
jgi:very-short-patch-repair endonuclease